MVCKFDISWKKYNFIDILNPGKSLHIVDQVCQGGQPKELVNKEPNSDKRTEQNNFTIPIQ
ncbi:hypothetical protein DCC35_06955 [Mangrovivirga cuniculi]|uniref:Uncharacterized protein n=1 Tax=Mangrovivirga cuniculi TaxID=2715131 RepID=A0A4D7K525_9BACT|nr:hypothetical protein DCC35_06955 [Mangrovivirga cuniculi]